jgi:hypothetical protein
MLILFGCRGSKYGQRTDDEVTIINIHKGQPVDLLAFRELEDAHNNSGEFASRGIFDSYGSTAAGLAVSGIKQLIENEKDKYNEEYDFVIEPNGHHLQNDSSYFYKSISDLPFNPSDIQFNGFTILRVCGKDTALKAVFELDKSNLTEIFYDGVFRLKLTEFEFNYARAKVYARGEQKVNLDFDIEFFSSFITKDGQLNNNMKIGEFTLNLPGVYLHNKDSCAKFADTRLNGYSFVVPRSYGYSVVKSKPIYSQGAYSIHVNVKETANPKIVNKFFTEHSNDILDNVGSGVGGSGN